MNTSSHPHVGFLGRASAGKDTAAEALVGQGYRRAAFADEIRSACLAVDPIVTVDGHRLSTVVTAYGWDDAKRIYSEVRRVMQQIGQCHLRVDPDVWIRPVTSLLDDQAGPVVVTDVRYPAEVAALRARGALLIYIQRPGVVDGPHSSESSVHPADADVVLTNGSSRADLWHSVREAVLGAALSRAESG